MQSRNFCPSLPHPCCRIFSLPHVRFLRFKLKCAPSAKMASFQRKKIKFIRCTEPRWQTHEDPKRPQVLRKHRNFIGTKKLNSSSGLYVASLGAHSDAWVVPFRQFRTCYIVVRNGNQPLKLVRKGSHAPFRGLDLEIIMLALQTPGIFVLCFTLPPFKPQIVAGKLLTFPGKDPINYNKVPRLSNFALHDGNERIKKNFSRRFSCREFSEGSFLPWRTIAKMIGTSRTWVIALIRMFFISPNKHSNEMLSFFLQKPGCLHS